MDEQILERLRKEFTFIGNERISGYSAMGIISNVVDELTMPKEVKQAQNYIAECRGDLGFEGSFKYDRQKKIVDAYYESISQKEEDITRCPKCKSVDHTMITGHPYKCRDCGNEWV